MASEYWDRKRYAARDRMDITENQRIAELDAIDRLEQAEAARFTDFGMRDLEAVKAKQLEEMARAKAAAEDLNARLKAARKNRDSQELVNLRNEMRQVIAFYEGDGARNSGYLSSLDAGYAKAQELIDDPGGQADLFFKKYQMFDRERP